MALTKFGFKTNLVSFWRQNRRRRGEEEKREEEKRKRKKRRGRRNQDQRYGATNLEYGAWIFGMDPWFCLVNGFPQT